jgi:hypothetical protein
MTESNQKSPTALAGSFPGAAAIDRLNEQVKMGHQAWMERLQEMQAIESEFTKELVTTRDPSAALKICNRWIAKRVELLAADSKAFTGFWMDLVMTAANGPHTPVGPTQKKGEDA